MRRTPGARRPRCCVSSAARRERCCAAASSSPDFPVAIYLIPSNNHLMKSNKPPDPKLERQIGAIRGFSRFYTRKLGISEPKLLDSPWTLQEARIIYEIAERQNCTATDLVRALGLDAGFLSRTLQALQRRQIVARKPSRTDRRVTELALTAKGRAAFAELDSRSHGTVAALLGKLDAGGPAARGVSLNGIERTTEPGRNATELLLASQCPHD